MNDGMLWFDNSNTRDLTKKIARCVQYYKSKYGTTPTLCFIHPTMLIDQPVKQYLVPVDDSWKEMMWTDSLAGTEHESVSAIEVRATNSVLPNHFWIGSHG